jgi:hypothetical protein
MWRTQEGERVLKGAEAALFREAIGFLWDQIEIGEEMDFEYVVGLRMFDALTVDQKLAILVEVAEALLEEGIQAPELTGVNEAAVAAVFRQVAINVELELDSPPIAASWRQMIVDACREVGTDHLPDQSCDDLGEWDFWICVLQDRILWDEDYADDGALDSPPEVRDALSCLMGTSAEYYVALARDPQPEERAGLKKRLKALVRG